MITEFVTGSNLLIRAIEAKNRLTSKPAVKAMMILACDENNFSEKEYKQLIPESIPVFGGIFPQIIFENKNYKQGLLLLGLEDIPDITVVENISNGDQEIEALLDDSILDEYFKTLFVFVDGFAKRIADFIQALFNVYGIELNFLGGGAGSLSMEQKPSIITNKGLLEDAAVIAAVKSQSGIGVKHGWMPLSGPFKVSHSEGNVIHMLDNKPAFTIYKQVVEEDSGNKISSDNFFEMAKAYPFGIGKLGEEKIVRDPIMLQEDGSMVCVGEVPQNTFVDILKGNHETLINASKQALKNARNSLPKSNQNEQLFFIDCISRVLFLEDVFSKELDAIAASGLPVVGILTLGEIANNGKDYLEFYNKTSVVAIFQNL